MPTDERPLRADAERNRRRLLHAAEALFTERGLEVGVGEIAEAAGVGRGTFFRNFPSKDDLIAAIVIERMSDAAGRARELLDVGEPGAAVFGFLEEIVGAQQRDRALFEAVGDTFLAREDIHAAYAELMRSLDALLGRAQESGAIRADVGSLDVLMMVKGVCQAASSWQHLDPEIGQRQMDLVRSALSPGAASQPLRGRARTLADMDAPAPPAPAQSAS